MASSVWPKFLIILSIITVLVPIINGTSNQRKLDDTTIPLTPDTSIKCGCSSCNPCTLPPPPPPPAFPPPPPFCPPPPETDFPPPPPKKPPTPSNNYPPTPLNPYSPLIFIPGPPGVLYPIDAHYSGSNRRLTRHFPAALIYGLAGIMMALW